VSQVSGGTGVLMKRIQAEAQNPQSDIIWGAGFSTLAIYKDYFEPYASPQAAQIPADMRDPENRWAASNVHVMVVMSNARRLKDLPVPKNWADLFDPKYKGLVAMGDPAKSGSTYFQVYGLYKMFGAEGLEKLARNAVVLASSGQVYKGVGTGEYPLSITMEYSAYEYVAGGQKEIALTYPAEGTFLQPEGMALVKGARNGATAKTLYDALLSKEVQEAVLQENFRRPSRTDIQVSKLTELPELSAIKVFALDQAEAARDYDKVIALWNEALVKAKQ
jgi:iron(III) transport system substrate-binding protein